jgi:ATP-dependent helicase/nuclease subunit B
MSARFVIGRAGSGKTAHLLERTIAACREDALGEPIIWIVPRQATFLVERELCCGGDLNGFFRVQVVSFELLAREILAEVGGGAAAEVTHGGRLMILGRLLRQHQSQLRFFRGVAATGGLAEQVSAALDEMDRGGTDLSAVVPKIFDPANAALGDKLADLALIQTAYASFLGGQRIDPDARQRQALEAMEQSGRLRAATIFVDGFSHFTHAERRMVGGLARVCREMQISLTMDTESTVLRDVHQMPDEMSLFHQMEMEYRALAFAFSELGVKVEKPVLLRERHRFATAGLRQLETWTAGPAAVGVELMEAPDKRAEVEIAARRIGDWVASGWRWRDIAVLTRQVSEYHDLIEAIFSEHGIPYFVDQRRTAAHHPAIQFLRAVVEAAAEPWDPEAMLSIIKSGLCGLTADEADELENELLLHELRGRAWAESANPLLRRVVDPLRAFVAAAGVGRTGRQWAEKLLAAVDAFGIRRTLAEWIAQSPPEQAQEHQQVWTEICELFDQLVELLGEQVMELDEFQSMLNGALEQFDLAIAPPTVDQVLVGQVDRTRTAAIKGCIVLGLSDGQFPMPAQRQSILSDADHRALGDLEPNWQRRALDEEYLGYFAFTRASQQLVVTRPANDEAKRAIAPSSLWLKVARSFPAATQEPAVTTPRQLVGGLMQWARREASEADSWQAPLYQWLTTKPERVENVRRRAWPALSYANKAEIMRNLARKLFPIPLAVEVRQLETYAACPFQHFVRYGLGLKPRKTAAVNGGDLWRVCHDVLRRLGRDVSDDQLGRFVAEAAAKLKSDGRLDDARHEHLLARMTSTLRQVAATQAAAAARGQFALASRSIRYGAEEEMSGLAVQEKLLIGGEIDRVDTSSDAAVLHDYRLDARPLRLSDVYYGLSLELVVHLLAWQQAGRQPPAVAVLASSMLRRLSEGSPDEALSPGDEAFHLLHKSRGLIDERFADQFDKALLSGGASDVIAASRNKGGEFGNRDKSDILTPHELDALLAHVGKLLAEMAGDITSGVIEVRPYRMRNQTPCAMCSFNDVCRFDPREGYRLLQPMRRGEVLERVCAEQGK